MLRFSDLVVTSCTVLVLLTGPATSAADPIAVQVTAGSLNMSGIGGALSLVGDHDFTFLGGVGVVGGIFGPSITCQPCLPGDVISLQAHWDGNDLGGTATFEGATYTQVGSPVPGHAFGSVTFTGSAVAPPMEGLTATVIAPFLFQGLFSFPPSGYNRRRYCGVDGEWNSDHCIGPSKPGCRGLVLQECRVQIRADTGTRHVDSGEYCARWGRVSSPAAGEPLALRPFTNSGLFADQRQAFSASVDRRRRRAVSHASVRRTHSAS